MLTQLRKTFASQTIPFVMFTLEFRAAFFFLSVILKLSPDKKLSKFADISYCPDLPVGTKL